ncbi:CBS domain-containing protein [Actinomadura decatromicini]|nr:CBS domain-containing protein [Actinomadura decatromicini]
MKRLTVADVMTRAVVTVTEDAPFAEIADAMTEHRISAVPVVDGDDRLTGIVTEADLLHKQERKGEAGPRPHWPRRHARTDAKARAALPVVGDDGRPAGIVARRDLLRAFHRSDAEIRDEVVRDLAYDHDDTRPTSYPRA